MLSAFSDSLFERESLDGIRAVPLSFSDLITELMFVTLEFINSDIPMSRTLTDSANDPRQ